MNHDNNFINANMDLILPASNFEHSHQGYNWKNN